MNSEIVNMEVAEAVSLPQILGPVSTIAMLLIIVAMLSLFVAGLISRSRQGKPWLFGWWLRNLSICSTLIGFFAYSAFWMRFYDSIGHASMINPELLSTRQFEAYTRLTVPLCIALVGWILGMILGPKKEN